MDKYYTINTGFINTFFDYKSLINYAKHIHLEKLPTDESMCKSWIVSSLRGTPKSTISKLYSIITQDLNDYVIDCDSSFVDKKEEIIKVNIFKLQKHASAEEVYYTCQDVILMIDKDLLMFTDISIDIRQLDEEQFNGIKSNIYKELTLEFTTK